MINRMIYSSIFRSGVWCVESDGEVLSKHETQVDAEDAAHKDAKDFHEKGGLSQAVFYLRSHTFKGQQTYGKDPLPALA